ncbi:unnamed protein product [Chilo suppressalis]|uniref:TNFR-Cys domain-containing protein n=1 Tax=Chilo suppressalis TaxID=168631 RepID=A0ABN8B3E4_CHISP|nr:hypothetical protein evm_010295 [Chilo suppressalis]CAH0401929.1 unnamed protein product [Chilo suppressalis]
MWRLACLLAFAGAVAAQLTLHVKCGQLTCQLDEYCSPETNRCASCSSVCNQSDHNYDSGLCLKQCQGYLLRKVGESSPVNGSVQREAKIALILSSVALAILLLVIVIWCKERFSWNYIKQKLLRAKARNKNRVTTYPGDIMHQNPHAEMPKPKPDLKLEIRNPEPKRIPQPLNPRDLDTRTSQAEKSQAATTPKTISTALSNRHPAEDTTLDFSYDNVAMNETPPEHVGLPTNRF